MVKQVVDSIVANSRQVIANTKGRGEVSGGGRKPWKQKAPAGLDRDLSGLRSGRAAALLRAKKRQIFKKINKKMMKKAMIVVLAGRPRMVN